MSKPNVLILKFPYSSLFGGGEKHTVSLVEELRAKGYRFYLASSCKVLLNEFKKREWPAKKIWAPKEPVSKGSLAVFPVLAPYFFLRLVFLLINYRFSRRIKIIYCLSLTEKILATLPARMLGIKVLWVEHVTFERWLTMNPLKYFYTLLSKFARIVVISQAIKKQLVENLKINPRRITLIYNGVNIPAIKVSGTVNNRCENKHEFVIGTVARLEKEKGLEYLLQAVERAGNIIPNLKLVIVGDGSEKKNLQWLANHINISRIVQFVGFQENVNLWLRDFDVFVLPSAIRESFGIVLVEAMANLRPVIASRVGGVSEIIDDKKTGLLVEPKNVDALAQAIISIYNNPPEITLEMIRNARRKTEEMFSKERMIESFEKLFAELAG